MKTTSMAGRTWHYSHCMGRLTAEHNGRTGGYAYPMDVAAAGGDMLFVVSRGLGVVNEAYAIDAYCRIGKTTIDEDHIGDLARGQFAWPAGIDVASDGDIYVSDEYANTISWFADKVMTYPEYDLEGERLGSWGEAGSEEGQLSGPSGIEFDAEDNLYVVDSLNDRVQKFTKRGDYISGWGKTGSGEGRFDRPWGITIDSAGDVYVADWGNHLVQKFSPNGDFLMSFGGDAELCNPSGVAVDSDGDVYVTDWGNNRVQIFEADGAVITALYGDAAELSKAGVYNISRDAESIKKLRASEGVMEYLARFGRPIGITVDDKDRIVITDARGRLQVYVKDHDYVVPNV